MRLWSGDLKFSLRIPFLHESHKDETEGDIITAQSGTYTNQIGRSSYCCGGLCRTSVIASVLQMILCFFTYRRVSTQCSFYSSVRRSNNSTASTAINPVASHLPKF